MTLIHKDKWKLIDSDERSKIQTSKLRDDGDKWKAPDKDAKGEQFECNEVVLSNATSYQFHVHDLVFNADLTLITVHSVAFFDYLSSELHAGGTHLPFVERFLDGDARIDQCAWEPGDVQNNQDDNHEVVEGLGNFSTRQVHNDDDRDSIDDEKADEEEDI